MTNLDHIEENLIDLTDSEKLNEILFEDGQNTIGLLFCLSFFFRFKILLKFALFKHFRLCFSLQKKFIV